MRHIVGIDPSLTNCGIAVLECDNPPKPSTAKVTLLRSVGHAGHNADDWATRSKRIVTQARYVLSLIPRDVELAVIEGPAYGTNLPSTHDRAGLWWGLLSGLLAAQIPTAVVNPKTRAKWATGKGNAQKPDVLAAVRNQWPDTRVPNHDCADALTLASMGALWSGWTLPFDVQTWQHNGLQSVTWPQRTPA